MLLSNNVVTTVHFKFAACTNGQSTCITKSLGSIGLIARKREQQEWPMQEKTSGLIQILLGSVYKAGGFPVILM